MSGIIQMRRRWLLVGALAVLAVLIVLLWPSARVSHCDRYGKCPPIVLIILDDMAWDHFGFLSPDIKLTPGIDALAAQGYVFSDAYNSNARCRPSLATLLTGRLPHQNGIYANHGVLELRDEKALPLLLRQAGYETFAGGKFWEGKPELMDFSASDVDTFHFARQSQDALATFLDKSTGSPVFIWWAPMLPHRPHDVSAEYLQQVSQDSIALPFEMSATQAADYRQAEHAYRATIRKTDDAINELLQLLEKKGLRDDSWIFLLADNGWDAARTAKGSSYDIGVRTPLVIIGPTVKSRRSVKLVSTQNLYGSILSLAGIDVDNTRQPELDLIKVAQGDLDVIDAPVFWASYPGYTGKSEPLPRPERDVYALSLRDGKWQYTFYVKSYDASSADEEKAPVVIHSGFQQQPDFVAGDEELFDLSTDPYSSRNLAIEPLRQPQLMEYRKKLLMWWQQTGGKPIDALQNCVNDTNILCERYRQVSGDF